MTALAATDTEKLLAQLAEHVPAGYRSDVAQFLAFVRERNLDVVDGFRAFTTHARQQYQAGAWSARSVAKKLAAAKNRLRYAFSHSAWAHDLRARFQLEELLAEARPPKVQTVAVDPEEVPSLADVQALISGARDTSIALIAEFLASTGVRISEALGIRLADLRQSRGRYYRATVRGKAAKERTVYLEAELLARIRAHFAGTTWLFEHHGRQYSRNSVTSRISHEALRTCGREFSAHDLRHFYATHQLASGASLKAVSQQLGHSSVSTTANIYQHDYLEPEQAVVRLRE
jgi:integrase